MQYLITLFLNLIILFTTNCGFRLQTNLQIPKELKILRLVINNSHSLFKYTIKQQLLLHNITLIDKNLQNIPILKIDNLSENIKTISIYQDGKSAEKQLKFSINAQIILPDGTGYPVKTNIECTLLNDQLEILAKDTENEFIKQEMYKQAANKLIRKLIIFYNTIIKKT